ncbi:MAG TPA: DUF2911 domain-containing protein [Niabella sp.]|mgnify:CR=1 FL=1|nr:DUF2911 domain-containing protein [Niabella sp.]HOZ96150.1 DUF2911 domain-containing protein [Niabella sp.]HQW13516.1 DUF2911 domain-containing protein [Niabella sp.]HQX18910.1 DUF2911 domain-containing protein [Niabella sp.]HQX41802.1 DUF2911 domain-containing protein [Niabella sp.]
MKRIILFTVAIVAVLLVNAQGGKPKSPLATSTAEIGGGAVITINYSQPSVKGRTIGKNLEPLPGQVWRTGANKATVFEVSKNVMVEGKELPAGKYALFTLAEGDDWTIIFNKTWDQWGAFKYSQADDALRVNVKSAKASPFAETLNINAAKTGVVAILWGDHKVSFKVK